MVHGDLTGVCLRTYHHAVWRWLMLHGLEGNILINQNARACITGFSLLRIAPDGMSSTSTISFSEGGTIRWMSPELLDPESFGLKDGRQTNESDCYALGMVIYEVLSGQAPFAPYRPPVIIRKVVEGDRPGRPQGMEAAWFTDELWGMLELCWKPQPQDRPSVETVLKCLEGVPRPTWLPRVGGSTEAHGDEGLNLTTSDAASGDLSGHDSSGLPVL